MAGWGKSLFFFFFLLLSITPLEQWGLDQWDIAEVTFTYLNITSANYNHLAGYVRIYTHTYNYINI